MHAKITGVAVYRPALVVQVQGLKHSCRCYHAPAPCLGVLAGVQCHVGGVALGGRAWVPRRDEQVLAALGLRQAP